MTKESVEYQEGFILGICDGIERNNTDVHHVIKLLIESIRAYILFNEERRKNEKR